MVSVIPTPMLIRVSELSQDGEIEVNINYNCLIF